MSDDQPKTSPPSSPPVAPENPAAAQTDAQQAAQPGAPAEETAKEAAESFKKGLGLLWSAARTTADEISREVKKGGVGDALQQAGRDLETAAGQAAKAVEDFIGRVGPGAPAATNQWPPPPTAAPGTQPPEEADPDKEGDVDGGIDPETGEPRDMRIQVEEN